MRRLLFPIEVLATLAFGHTGIRGRFARGTAWYLVFGILSQGSAVIVSIVVARALGATGFGRFGIVQSTTLLFGTAAGLGLGLATTKYVAEYRSASASRIGPTIGLATMLTGLLGGACSLLMLVLSPVIADRVLGAPEIAPLLAVASLTVALTAVNSTQNGALAGLEMYKPLAKAALVRSIVNVPIYVMATWQWGLVGAVWSNTIAAGVTCLVTGLYLRGCLAKHGIPVTYRSSLQDCRVLLAFGVPVALGGLSLVPVGWYINTLLVRQPAGYGEFGLFVAADKWRTMILFVPNYMSGVALSMLSHAKGADSDASYNRIFSGAIWSILGLTILSAATVLFLSKIFLSVYGVEFTSGRAILDVLAISSIPVILNTILGHRLISSGYVWQRLTLDVVLALTLLLSSVWLIPRWSGLGMAVASAVSYSVVCIALFVGLPTKLSSLAQAINTWTRRA